MKRSSSGDYNSIGLSLKRVKISTSPGEICLDRDIESLILSKRWTSTANRIQGDCDRIENSPRSSLDRRGIRAHVELYSHHARLVRDPVDPLKLRLTCLHQSSTSSTPTDSHNNNTPNDNDNTHAARPTTARSHLPPERWTFLIHIPRMFPHAPPTITHVNREYITNNENFAFLGNSNINLARHNSSLSAAMVASSVMQSHYLEPPAPEQVLINLLPPTELHSHNTRPQIGSGLLSPINNEQHLDIDSATSVCNSWTPVSTLQELLDFLIGLPGRRREWWATDVIRRSRDSLTASPLTIAPPVNNNSNTVKSYFSDSDSNEHQESQESYMSLGILSSPGMMDEDNNRDMTGGQQHVESMIEDSSQSPGGRRLVSTMLVDSPVRPATQAVGYK